MARVPLLTNSSDGVPVVRAFPFAFNTPNLANGAQVYTPTDGEVLLDAWIEIVEAWDVPARSDIGSFTLGGSGWFAWMVTGGIDMTQADYEAGGGSDGLLASYTNSPGLASIQAAMNAQNLLQTNAPTDQYLYLQTPHLDGSEREVPAKFIGDPIKVVVSVNGMLSGGDPGASQGSAILYLVTATPIFQE